MTIFVQDFTKFGRKDPISATECSDFTLKNILIQFFHHFVFQQIGAEISNFQNCTDLIRYLPKMLNFFVILICKILVQLCFDCVHICKTLI